MKYLSAVLLAIGLSSDVFFASFSQGLAIRKLTCKKLLGISLIVTAIQGGCAVDQNTVISPNSRVAFC